MSEAREIADARFAKGEIAAEEHALIILRIAPDNASHVSQARRISDLRLAKGEISADQHAGIIAGIASNGGSANGRPTYEAGSVPVAIPEKNEPTEAQANMMGGLGVVLVLAGIYIVDYRSNILEACVARGSTCTQGSFGGILAFLMVAMGALFVAGWVWFHLQNGKQKS